MIYGDLFNEFVDKTKIDKALINDWRPCDPLYEVPLIANAIVVWLNDGGKLIYIHEDK